MTKKKPPEEKETPGRPTDYKSEYADQAFKLCLLRATDEEIADFFGVRKSTINNRKKAHPEFLDSIKEGKEKADMEIVNSLYHRAKWMTIKKKEVVKYKISRDQETFEIVEYDQELPPDPQSIHYWLNNRKPKKRKSKNEISGDPENPIKLQIPSVKIFVKWKNDK